jgi:hypothetical protein
MCVCAGDCNDDGQVFPNEISVAVGISGGVVNIDQCRAADVSGDGQVFPNEISFAVFNAGFGCPRRN